MQAQAIGGFNQEVYKEIMVLLLKIVLFLVIVLTRRTKSMTGHVRLLDTRTPRIICRVKVDIYRGRGRLSGAKRRF